MTALPKDVRVSELREMFRHLQQLRLLHETDGVDEITSSFGNTWSLWDLEYLYGQTRHLALAQRRAITLCLFHGQLEREAAGAMGVGVNNPVGMYASLGLRRLLDMLDRGELDGYREQPRDLAVRETERTNRLQDLAAYVRSIVEVTGGHWLFPTPIGRTPVVLVRSPLTPSGCLSMDPRTVLYVAEHGDLPSPDFHVVSTETGPITCVSPHHSEPALTPEAAARLRAKYQRRVHRSRGVPA